MSTVSFNRFAIACCLVFTLLLTASALAQSTAAVQGTVTDASGAVVPNATVTVRNQSTGEERTTVTDSAGIYQVPSLQPGTYRVEVKAQGMASTIANDVVLEVGRTIRQDFSLQVATTTQTVEITAAAPVIENTTVAVGGVVNQQTVQEIPLNGRHFVDLALLVPGTVTPPASGFLTVPLRGQGSFAINTGGAREDQVNYMINGINLSDPSNNQITFQPVINTVEEFKIDNSTYSPEYGRNSGAIVNIATRAGTNAWHGEAYEFVRNTWFDARNFTDPVGTLFAPFKRNQFGADGGGRIVKDKTFLFLSYEGLRQRQFAPFSTTVLTDSQRTQAQASSDPIVKSLLPSIPAANSPGGVYTFATGVPVDIDQGTANFSHSFSAANRVNVYFAYQRDNRNEPPSSDANNLPDTGDQRVGRRQLLTFTDTAVISPTLVNEARLGYNRIHIVFNPDNLLNAANFGINSGVNAPIGLPMITVTGAFSFGGVNNLPQGRGDYSAAASDTLSWVHGKHSIKFGGEYRRLNVNQFSFTPGTFTFPSITAFLNDQASAFTANSANRAGRIFVNNIGGFVQDAWKLTPRLLLDLGLRYDWYGTPSEASDRFVVFDPTTVSLVQIGKPGGPSILYNQSAKNFEPRVGFAYDVFGTGRTVVRSAYAIMTDQSIIGLPYELLSNPPSSLPVSFSPSANIPFVTLANAFTVASGSVAPFSMPHDFRNPYAQEWNFNIQQQLPKDYGLMIGYFGTKGTSLDLPVNLNQFVSGARPYPALSASSPIFPGKALGNIISYESVANSIYNGLWIEVKKRFAKGLQFDSSYTFSKSIDDASRTNLISTSGVQDSRNIRGDRGLSDFDARNRWVFSGIYDLPFKGNRLVEGWELTAIVQLQSGNPVIMHTSNTSFTGLGTLRPSVTGPVQTGFTPSTDRNATRVAYIQNPSVFYCGVPGNQSCTGAAGNSFGNLGRNVVIGPGFANVDFALVKSTKITERLTWQVRADAFDLFNHPNFSQPGASPTNDSLGSATFTLLSATRTAPGDSGSSRQLQLSMKLIF
jgi:outer membrane receptor protein involved in Fe transport